jgi:hypothetical protein
MKLRAELSAPQILDTPCRADGSGAAQKDYAGLARAPQRTSPVLFRDLALSLGLPRDALTASLLSLAKFFSLPLDTKLLLRLRQQALSLGATKPPENQGPEKQDQPLAHQLRSAAFAAAAAAGKGVTLSPEALGSYAAALGSIAALAVEDRDDRVPEDGEAPGGDAGGEETPGDESGSAHRFSEPYKDGKSAFAEWIEGRLPLLGVLNRIPGRDGRRWISLPFSFQSGGIDFKVSLRIVLADTNSIPWKAELMALDIKTSQRCWSFMLENAPAAEGQPFARAVFGAQPPLKPRAERHLRELLGGVAEKLVLKDISGGAFLEEEAGEAPWEG